MFNRIPLLPPLLVGLMSAAAQLDADPSGPDVTEVEINGYAAFLVNTRSGNQVTLQVHVPAGSGHDHWQKFAGRAHLWEHVVHIGSRKYPGHGRFNSLMLPLGGKHNALTYHDRTSYFWTGHPDSFAAAADILGAALTDPNPTEEAFAAELTAVTNEAGEYLGRDNAVALDGLFHQLAPEGHPLKKYSVGTRDQLATMSLKDLLQFYARNYGPKDLRIIVAANLDPQANGEVALPAQAILATLQTAFTAEGYDRILKEVGTANEPAAAQLRVGPVVPESDPSIDQSQFVEFGTKGNARSLTLAFQEKDRLPHALRETLHDLINLRLPGSLYETLSRRGWVTSLSAYPYDLNDLRMTILSLDLTPSGGANRHAVTSIVLQTLGQLTRVPVSEEMAKYLAERNIQSYQTALRASDRVADYLAATFVAGDSSPAEALDLVARFGWINPGLIFVGARTMFDPTMVLGSYVGPDVQSGETNVLFNRPVRTLSVRSTQPWIRIPFDAPGPDAIDPSKLKPGEVPTGLVSTPRGRYVRKPRLVTDPRDSRIHIVFEETAHAPRGAVAVSIELPRSSVETVAARSLYISMFHDHHASFLDGIGAMGFQTVVRSHGTHLQIILSGNSGALGSVLTDLIDRLRAYEPTQEEFIVALEAERTRFITAEAGFPAHLANREVLSFLRADDWTSREMLNTLTHLDFETVRSLGLHSLLGTRLHIAAFGDLTEQDALQVSGLAQTFLLPAGDPSSQIAFPIASITGTLGIFRPLLGNRAGDPVGRARYHDGPIWGTREAAAMAMLGNELYDATFRENREVRGLGYVQGFNAYGWFGRSRLIFYGQSDGFDKLSSIEEGWETVLARVLGGDISQDGFESVRRAALLDEGLIPADELGAVLQLLTWLRIDPNDPQARSKYLDHLRSVSSEEIYKVGAKYLSGPKLEVIAAKSVPPIALSCGALFEDPNAVRRRLGLLE